LDSSSPSVRLAVISGLGQVLDQPLAHGVLKGLLPLLCNALHDKSQAVRLEFVRVLNKVKDIKGIHFYQIVSVEHLQRRLAADANRPSIRNAITELLLNSYYPQQHVNGGDAATKNKNQVTRCLRFVRENLPASIAFYTTFHKFASVGSASKLLIMLLGTFSEPASFWRENGGEAGATVGEKESSGNHAAVLAAEAMQVAVLRVMAACLDSIGHLLASPDNAHSKSLLLKYFAPDKIAAVSSRFCDADSESFNVAALPVFMRIVAAVWRLRDDAADQGDGGVAVVGDSIISRLLQQYGDASGSSALHAMAVAELCGSHVSGCSTAALVAVEESLRVFQAQALAQPAVPPVRGAAVLSLGAAVDLLGAVVCAAEPANKDVVGRTFARLRSVVDAVMTLEPEAAQELLQGPAHAGKDATDPTTVATCLVRGVHLWASHALRTATDSDASALDEVAVWTKATVVPARDTSPVGTAMLSAVVLVLSDALLFLGVVRGALLGTVGSLLEALGGGDGRFVHAAVFRRYEELLKRHTPRRDDLVAMKGLDATLRGLLDDGTSAGAVVMQ
jgi:hypothetical protein